MGNKAHEVDRREVLMWVSGKMRKRDEPNGEKQYREKQSRREGK